MRKEWTPEERDAAYSKVEPPGSYGFCWKALTPPREAEERCTKKPGHNGSCGQEDTMNKYGVDEAVGTVSQETLEKQAMQGCPKCGGRVERHGRILSCANCGTEPFEADK